jgi:hypothetical protein
MLPAAVAGVIPGGVEFAVVIADKERSLTLPAAGRPDVLQRCWPRPSDVLPIAGAWLTSLSFARGRAAPCYAGRERITPATPDC